MKNDLFERVRNILEIVCEKSLEWTEHLGNILTSRWRGGSHLSEEYSMKHEYMEEEYVKTFLREREWSIARCGYKMLLNSNYVSQRSEEIGIVTLRCKGKYIDHATLIAGPSISGKERIIYWNFDK